LSHRIVEQGPLAVKPKVIAAARFNGTRLRSDALQAALKRTGISGNERKVVECLAPLLERGPLAISNREIVKRAHVNATGATRGLRRAVEHGFIVRDETTRPHTYRLADEWLEGVA
jgi:hypothetical protein